MKLATYDPNVKLNNINGEVRAYDTGTAGAMMGRSLQGLAGAINFAGEQIDAVNVQAASNEYTKRLNDLMYNQENGLMNTKYQGADGITAKFEEEEKKIRQEVGKQFKFYSPKGTMVFDRLTNNSATQRYELVRKHQTQQFEAYQDKTFNNAIELNMQNSADSYTMPEVVAQNVNEALMSVAVRYHGQGEEVIKAEQRKAVGRIAEQVINRAFVNGSYTDAEAYLDKYGKAMDPAKYTALKKEISEQIISNKNIVDFDVLASQYKDLPTFIQKVGELYDSTHFDGVETYNMPTQGANIDEQVKQLTPEFRAALPAIGGILKHKFGLDAVISSGGRTYEHQMEINPSAPNSHHIIRENGGDAVDIVLPDGTTQEQYDKIKAYFENSGAFAEVLNHDVGSGYHLHLGGYRGGLDKKSSPMDRQRYINSAIAAFNRNKQIQKAAMDETLNAADVTFFEMYKNGETDPTAYNAKALELSRDNPELFRALMSTARSYSSVAKKASGASSSSNNGGNGLDPRVEPVVVDMMTTQGYSTEDILEWANRMKDNPTAPVNLNAKGCAKVLDLIQDRVNGKGAFAYNWKTVESDIMANYKTSSLNKDVVWANIKNGLIYQIDDYRMREHREPTPSEVIEMGKDYFTKHTYDAPGLFNTKDSTWKYDLARMGILYVSENANGDNDIVIKGPNGWVRRRLTDAELRRVVAGESVFNYTGESNYKS